MAQRLPTPAKTILSVVARETLYRLNHAKMVLPIHLDDVREHITHVATGGNPGFNV